MRISAADLRLSKTEFEAGKDWETYPRALYGYPNCGETLTFCLRDFDRHSRSDFSNLSDSDARESDRAALASGRKYSSFLDFYCARCKAPVRIYYLAWWGGRYTHGHSIQFVVEGEPQIQG